MECQRGDVRPVRLTDQGMLAVALARVRAEAAGRSATVADLLLGLAAEPDGIAGRLLRVREHAVVDLDRRALPATLAPLEVALSWAATDARPRPVGTADLLATALEVGGADLADVLDATGLDRWMLEPADTPHPLAAEAAGETVGLRPPGDPDPGLSQEAALAIARTRAVAGGAVDLLVAIAEVPDRGAVPAPLPDAANLIGAVERLGRRRGSAVAAREWDLGLDQVVEAARAWRAPGQVSIADLVRAAVLTGGDGPAAVLAEAERSGGD